MFNVTCKINNNRLKSKLNIVGVLYILISYIKIGKLYNGKLLCFRHCYSHMIITCEFFMTFGLHWNFGLLTNHELKSNECYRCCVNNRLTFIVQAAQKINYNYIGNVNKLSILNGWVASTRGMFTN